MTSQCCPTTSTLSSTSLLSEDERSDSTPRFESMNAQPALRSESREEASESWPGADEERWEGVLGFAAPLDEGRSAEEACEMGRCRMIVMAYMGLLRMCEG